jgi:hypothetical protein
MLFDWQKGRIPNATLVERNSPGIRIKTGNYIEIFDLPD